MRYIEPRYVCTCGCCKLLKREDRASMRDKRKQNEEEERKRIQAMLAGGTVQITLH